MSDGPERIATNTHGPGGELRTIEYVRADLYAALEARCGVLVAEIDRVAQERDRLRALMEKGAKLRVGWLWSWQREVRAALEGGE